MFRFAYVVGMAVVICLILCSCQSEQPTSPRLSDQYYSVHFSHLDSAIIALEGELYPTAFEVTVTDYDTNAVVSQAAVVLDVSSGPGHVAPEWALSDSSGVVQALYYLNVPYGDTASTIRAYAGAEPVEFEIGIHGKPAPFELQLSTFPEIFRTNYGQAYRGSLTATVIDKRGNGVPDQTVTYSVYEGYADIEDNLKTDHRGMATGEVHLDGRWFGDLVVVATMLHESPLVHIETKNKWSLWLESWGLIPVILRDCFLDTPTSCSLVDTLTVPVKRR